MKFSNAAILGLAATIQATPEPTLPIRDAYLLCSAAPYAGARSYPVVGYSGTNACYYGTISTVTGTSTAPPTGTPSNYLLCSAAPYNGAEPYPVVGYSGSDACYYGTMSVVTGTPTGSAVTPTITSGTVATSTPGSTDTKGAPARTSSKGVSGEASGMSLGGINIVIAVAVCAAVNALL